MFPCFRKLKMETLSEQTLSGLTEKEIKQLAKRCPIVMTITEDVNAERFDYIEQLDDDKTSILADMKVDLEDALVSDVLDSLEHMNMFFQNCVQNDYTELKAKEQLARKKFHRKKDLEKNPNLAPLPIDKEIKAKETSTTLKTKV